MNKDLSIYLSAFLIDVAFIAVGLCIPLRAIQLGADYKDLGLIGAAGSLCYCLSSLFCGRLSERVGYRRTLTGGSTALVMLILMFPLMDRVGGLIALTAMMGVVTSNCWPPMQAWLGEGKGFRTLRFSIAAYNISWSLGILSGPALGGRLFDVNSVLPFYASAGFAGLAVLIVLTARDRKSHSAQQEETTPQTNPEFHHLLPIAWLANFATFFSHSAVRQLFPKLTTDLDIGPVALGNLLALIGISQTVTFIALALIVGWQFRTVLLFGAEFVGIASLAVFAYGESTLVFAIALLGLGLAAGVTFSFSIFHTLYSKIPLGRRTGINEAIVGSGFMLGPLLGGYAAELFGSRSPYILGLVILLLTIGLQIYLLARGSKHEACGGRRQTPNT